MDNDWWHNDPDVKFYAGCYYYSSEAYYRFGPFDSLPEAEQWCEQNADPDKHEDWRIELMNVPKMYGTGLEIS